MFKVCGVMSLGYGEGTLTRFIIILAVLYNWLNSRMEPIFFFTCLPNLKDAKHDNGSQASFEEKKNCMRAKKQKFATLFFIISRLQYSTRVYLQKVFF